MKMKHIVLSSVLAITLFACKKEKESTVLLRMTDAPTELDAVNIDLKQVNIKFDNDSTSWVAMDTKPGIYNLLEFQNGVDTLIAQGTYPTDVVKEIRLVLGENNSIITAGQTYPLTVPSGSESGLKIKVNKKLNATIENLLIDFDALLSIQKETDGYKLRPVIKLK